MEPKSIDSRPASAGNRVTRGLLLAGAAAGPLYVAVGLLQALTRPGFDLTRHELSLLSNGTLGWIQITNFVLSGALVIAGAAGMRRALRSARGGTWGPLLLGVYGLGLIGAGVFVADPMNGFPPGAAAGMPKVLSPHAVGHLVSGSVGFIGLIVACFVFARRFASRGRRGWAAYSLVTGVLFLAAFLGIASGSQQRAINVAFGIAVVLGWAWITAVTGGLVTEMRGSRLAAPASIAA
jgi:hypothetical membrane protein